jgi:glycosyltransferase involved in cell wall biosynthesis
MMSQNKALPLVSIIIPLYNAEKYVEETLQSVLEQSFEGWECIVVDDHSTDDSYLVAQRYILQYPNKFKLFRNPRKGACAARNFGFEQSTGEYIQYLDADDILSPHKLSSQLEQIQKFGNNYVYSCRWGRFYDSIADVKWAHQAVDKDYEPSWQWLNDSWQGKGMTANSCWLTHKDMIQKAGNWDENLLVNQDGDFFARVLLHSKAVKFVDEKGVYYRSGNTLSISQSSRYTVQKATSLLNSYKAYNQYAIDHEVLQELKQGLGNNFLMFMYQYHRYFPNLVAQAEKDFYQLGYKKMWPVGGRNFILLAKWIGFKNALILTSLLKRLKNND